MIQSFEQRHAPGSRLCPAFGGSSSSVSSTTNNTKTSDMRVVGGDNSTNASTQIDATNSTVTVTDMGAVKAGMELGTKAIDASTKSAAAALDAGGNIFDGALNAVSDANQRLALAYQSGQAGDQTSLKYAGFVVVGLAAVMLLKKG